MRLIDADKLKERFIENKKYYEEFGMISRVDILENYIETIDNAPTVEARPQGEWVCNPTYCYKCNQTNCGADMRKEADNE